MGGLSQSPGRSTFRLDASHVNEQVSTKTDNLTSCKHKRYHWHQPRWLRPRGCSRFVRCARYRCRPTVPEPSGPRLEHRSTRSWRACSAPTERLLYAPRSWQNNELSTGRVADTAAEIASPGRGRQARAGMALGRPVDLLQPASGWILSSKSGASTEGRRSGEVPEPKPALDDRFGVSR